MTTTFNRCLKGMSFCSFSWSHCRMIFADGKNKNLLIMCVHVSGLSIVGPRQHFFFLFFNYVFQWEWNRFIYVRAYLHHAMPSPLQRTTFAPHFFSSLFLVFDSIYIFFFFFCSLLSFSFSVIHFIRNSFTIQAQTYKCYW